MNREWGILLRLESDYISHGITGNEKDRCMQAVFKVNKGTYSVDFDYSWELV